MRGSVLVFSLLVLAMLLSAALSGAAIVVLGKSSSKSTVKSTLAFQIADGAVENVLRRVYHENDASLDALANRLYGTSAAGGGNPACATGVISGKLPNSQGVFQVAFYDGTGTKLGCNGAAYDTYAEWRTALTRIVSTGTFAGSTRAVDVAIAPAPCGGVTQVVDTRGVNVTYDTVEIGTQCWMKQNMRVGTMISTPQLQIDNPGGNIIEKYCYNNQATNCTNPNPPATEPDGGLYTWDEAMQYDSADAQGICPDGWHIPTDNEWYMLEHFLDATISDPPTNGGTGLRGTDAGTKLKPLGSSDFEFNLSGLGALGAFSMRGTWGVHWSSSEASPSSNAWYRLVQDSQSEVIRSDLSKAAQFSVRCIKD